MSDEPNDPNPFPNLSLAYEWVRAWWYRANLAIGALLAFYGLTSDEAWALWAALISTFFSTGLAAKNTSTKK